ncbi:MAG TPA: TraR/DksA C4-type zinc finger protein [Nannocystaceae bacterium]|nr:TraR/DksA C4-type zinc finger protein [Nannocystaceae bacterium]
MDHLREHEVAALRRRLEDERAALLARAGDFVREGADFALDTGDRQDLPAYEAARAGASRLAAHERRRLTAVTAALDRIGAGTYGICEASGEPIPFPRLAIEPTARYTVAAQAELEAEAEAEAEEEAAY